MNVQVRFKTRVIAEAATSVRCKTDAGAVYSNFCSYFWPENISLASLHVKLCKLFGQSPDGDERVGFCNRGGPPPGGGAAAASKEVEVAVVLLGISFSGQPSCRMRIALLRQVVLSIGRIAFLAYPGIRREPQGLCILTLKKVWCGTWMVRPDVEKGVVRHMDVIQLTKKGDSLVQPCVCTGLDISCWSRTRGQDVAPALEAAAANIAAQ